MSALLVTSTPTSVKQSATKVCQLADGIGSKGGGGFGGETGGGLGGGLGGLATAEAAMGDWCGDRGGLGGGVVVMGEAKMVVEMVEEAAVVEMEEEAAVVGLVADLVETEYTLRWN